MTDFNAHLARVIAGPASGMTPEQALARLEAPQLARVPRASAAERRARTARLDAAAVEHGAQLEAGAPVLRRRGRRPGWAVPNQGERRKRWLAGLFDARGADYDPTDLSPRAFQLARMASSGRAGCLSVLAGLPFEYARRVRRAALGTERPDGGAPSRSWDHASARLVVAVGAILYHEARATRRRGFARVLGGLTRAMLGAACRNPQTLAPYSLAAITRTSGRTAAWYDCGPLPALERAGAIYREQPPPDCVPPSWVGRDRDGNPRSIGLTWISEAHEGPELGHEHVRALEAREGDPSSGPPAPSSGPPPPS